MASRARAFRFASNVRTWLTAVGQSKGHKRKKQEEEKKAQEKKEDTVPLPVGHEAKGFVLPDYDLRRAS